jgi:hypothetical protein
VTAAIDNARLPFLVDLTIPAEPGDDGGEDQGEDGPGKPKKRGGRRVAAECACQLEPRRIQLTPKQIEDGPIMCGLCCAPFELPEDEDQRTRRRGSRCRAPGRLACTRQTRLISLSHFIQSITYRNEMI